jgi:hypothetical protein
MTSTLTAMTSQTLSQCLSQGRIPVAEALRYSMMLAEALRKLHEGGRAHGAVSPLTINLTATGLELMPAPPIDEATPYKSPEVLAGQPADARSDIFSFGAVVYEMLTGKRAFEGAERGAMAPSGSPSVDRLVSGCMAADPAARIQRIQKVMLELKLLAVSAARAATPVPPRRDPDADAQLLIAIEQAESRILARVQAHESALAETQRLAGEVLHHDATAETAMRTEILQLEVRMANRMKASEKIVADLQTAVSEAVNREPEVLPDFALRSEVQQIDARVAGRLEQMEARVAALLEQTEARFSGLAAQIEQRFGETLGRLERLEQAEPPVPVVDTSHLEEALEQMRRQMSEFQDLVAQDFQTFEKSLQTQATAIESARTAMAQTDDLVERVVEALESLQSTVLENSEERALAIG